MDLSAEDSSIVRSIAVLREFPVPTELRLLRDPCVDLEEVDFFTIATPRVWDVLLVPFVLVLPPLGVGVRLELSLDGLLLPVILEDAIKQRPQYVHAENLTCGTPSADFRPDIGFWPLHQILIKDLVHGSSNDFDLVSSLQPMPELDRTFI